MYNDKLSGLQIVNVCATLHLTDAVQIKFRDFVEISLDCSTCLALHRTIDIYENQDYGICRKTEHQFPIKINSKSIKVEKNFAEVTYQVEYWYSPFFDPKHNKESQCFPRWGRVHFILTCPKCLTKNEASMQNNTVRPFTKVCMGGYPNNYEPPFCCSFPLYSEKDEMPIFLRSNE